MMAAGVCHSLSPELWETWAVRKSCRVRGSSDSDKRDSKSGRDILPTSERHERRVPSGTGAALLAATELSLY